jgi:hypothetical protein
LTFQDTLGTGLLSGISVTNEVGGTYTKSAPRKIDIVNFEGDIIDHPDGQIYFSRIFKSGGIFSKQDTVDNFLQF